MTRDELELEIKNNLGVMVYFSGEECDVCHALRPKIKELFSDNFSLIEQIFLDAKENIELASSFNVFSVPILLVFLDGKEFLREGRNMSIVQIDDQLGRIYDIMTS